jgi:hypothetical protein
MKYAFVVVNYFKWIEARTVPNITTKIAQKFFWKTLFVVLECPSN